MLKTKQKFNHLIIYILLFTFSPELYSEEPYKKIIYTTFISHEMNKWQNVIQLIETKYTPVTVEKKIELLSYYYGFTGYLIREKRFDEVETYITKAEVLIDQILKTTNQNATVYSYKAAFFGFQISINKIKGIYLINESFFYLEKAYKLDPNNVQVNIDKGNILFHAPAIFGGDKKEALKFYLKGARLMELNNITDQNWAYLNVLTMIAKTYEKMDQPLMAKQTYERILRKEPNFYWVKRDLYPKFLEKNKL